MKRGWIEWAWAFALGVASLVMLPATDASLGPVVPFAIIVCYLAGRRMQSLRLAMAAVACGGVLALLGATLSSVSDFLTAPIPVLVVEFAFVVLPWWIGRYRKLRAERIERERMIISDQARQRERGRLAQDMHDLLGHELALIALRSGALEVAVDASAEQRRAAGEVRKSAVAATERLHEILGVLREPGEAAADHPVNEGVPELVDRFQRSGMDVHLETGPGAEQWSSAAQQGVHRVVQEGLTNAAKHAPGAQVEVTVTQAAGDVHVQVASTAATGPPVATGGSGLGLVGLQERVRLLGGHLEAGGGHQGYRLMATLPVGATLNVESEAGVADGSLSLSSPRRLTRRQQRRSAVLPVTLAAVLIAILLSLQAITVIMTALPADSYAQLSIGQTRAEIAPLLPSHSIEAAGVPSTLVVPPAPPGGRCEFYQARNSILDFSSDLYRLCFDDQMLVSKDWLTPKETP